MLKGRTLTATFTEAMAIRNAWTLPSDIVVVVVGAPRYLSSRFLLLGSRYADTMYLAALRGQDIVDGPRRATKRRRRRPSRATNIILNTASTDGRLAGKPLSETKNCVLAHARAYWGSS